MFTSKRHLSPSPSLNLQRIGTGHVTMAAGGGGVSGGGSGGQTAFLGPNLRRQGHRRGMQANLHDQVTEMIPVAIVIHSLEFSWWLRGWHGDEHYHHGPVVASTRIPRIPRHDRWGGTTALRGLRGLGRHVCPKQLMTT